MVKCISTVVLLLAGVAAAVPARAEPLAPPPDGHSLSCTLERAHDGVVSLCTHGPDPHERIVGSRVPPVVEATAPAPVTAVPCYGDGQAGNRVQAVYAVPSDQPDRFDEVVGDIRRWAAEVDDVVAASARFTGGVRHVRFVTTPDCVLDVLRVEVSPLADETFAATVSELAGLGLSRADRKYLVWMESDVLCGQANFYLDDRPGQDNANNGPSRIPGTVARVDRGCWGFGSRGQSVEVHELVHSLGAVLPSAPHATTFAHCTDDADRMCYADGSPAAQVKSVCAPERESLLDCGHDDYFHTTPPVGSHLDGHWNTASSSFLATSEPPPPPAGVVARLAGTDRVATSVVASIDAFPEAGSARAAVIANSVRYPDALAGVPLAARVGGPLLLNPAFSLDGRILAELRRVLDRDATVYLLGGTAALAESVEAQIVNAGHRTVRYGGANRFATAVIVAEEGLDSPDTTFEATGLSFPDALAAGAAAAVSRGAVLLTNGSTQAPETAAYLLRHPASRRYALGGPAAAADPLAERVAGADRYATATAVAARFFPAPTIVGVASGVTFPDALSGGANIATRAGPVLLTTREAPVPRPVIDYLREQESLQKAIVYGGHSSLDDGVTAALARAIGTR